MKNICSKIQEEMGIYLYEEASSHIQEHLEECQECQKHWKTLQETKSYLDNLLPSPSLKSEEDFVLEIKKAVQKKQLFAQKWKVATLAASVIITIWLGFFSTTNSTATSDSNYLTNYLANISWLTPEVVEYIKIGKQSEEENLLGEENEMMGGELTWLTPERLELLKYGNYE